MIKSDIKLIQATIEDYHVIQNMAQFYVYDVSRECGFILSADGRFEPNDYKVYLQSKEKLAYIVKINGELAGFVLLNEIGISDTTDWKIDQFFVLAKFQGKGLGRNVFQQLLQKHTGHWELTVLPDNKSALLFWQRVIGEHANNQYKQEMIKVEQDKIQPNRILLSFSSD